MEVAHDSCLHSDKLQSISPSFVTALSKVLRAQVIYTALLDSYALDKMKYGLHTSQWIETTRIKTHSKLIDS